MVTLISSVTLLILRSKMSGTIKLNKKTKDALKQIGVMGETYDDVVSLLVEVFQDFKSLMDATSRSEAGAKEVASRLSSKYERRIKRLKGE